MTYMLSERRQVPRIPVGFYANQLVDDQPERCFTTSLSTSGLYMERLLTPLERTRETVQVEIPLPGAPETLWARGRVVYDCFDALFHGSAVRFTAMPNRHRRMLREWLHDRLASLSTGEVVRAAPGISIFRPPPIRL